MGFAPNQFTGCLLGLASGDALGAPHEGGPIERLLWRLIGRTRDGALRWTDDTLMAIDLAESLLEHRGVEPDALAQRFAASYRWSRGYGPGTAKILKRIRRGQPWAAASKAVYGGGSYGNGAAMRAPVLALYFARDREALIAAARSSAAVTHAHPLGIEGAVAIALAAHALLEGRTSTELFDLVGSACSSPEMTERLGTARGWLAAGAMPKAAEVAKKLGNATTVPTSCPTALYIALRHRDTSFETMIDFVIAGGGDVDTIGAMAGALWGIIHGAERLPPLRLEARDQIADVAMRLFKAAAGA